MKRISLILLAMLLALSLCACSGDEIASGETTEGVTNEAITTEATITGETEIETVYTARHMTYDSEIKSFDEQQFSVVLCGDQLELFMDTNTSIGDGLLSCGKGRLVGTTTQENGYYLIDVTGLYSAVSIEGDGAAEYVASALETYNGFLSDDTIPEETKRQIEETIRMLNGEEVDQSYMCDEGAMTVKVKLENGKMTEFRMRLEIDGLDSADYWYTYDEQGVQVTSKCQFRDGGESFMVEYYPNGIPKTYTEDREDDQWIYQFDEDGVRTGRDHIRK